MNNKYLNTCIIFCALFFSNFKGLNASLRYTDNEPDNLISLSKKFDPKSIQDYKEDLGADAHERIKNIKEKLGDYFTKNNWIFDIVQFVASEALTASQKIIETCVDESTIIYLGRSPSILLTTSNFFESNFANEKKLNHIQINFSGTPNISNVRNYEVNDLRNVVTKERLEHFYSYLDLKGLNNLTPNSQLYIVDQIGRGGGMNAFLRILRGYYISNKAFEDTPKITLLLMNFENQKSHHQQGCYFYNSITSDLIFSASNVTDMKYRAMIVKAIGLEMDEKEGGALDAMDDDAVQYYLLKGREYPAFCWTQKYDEFRDSDPELAETFTSSLIQRLEILKQNRSKKL